MKKKKIADKKSAFPLFESNAGYYFLVAVGILLITIIRLRLASMPLIRDEGEFAYIAQRILKGDSPFSYYNYKLPGVSYLYAFFMLLFGENIMAVRLGVTIANGLTMVLIFLTLRNYKGYLVATVASISYGLLSLDTTVSGLLAHATQFVNLFMVAGLYFLFRKNKKAFHFFLAGLMMGLSFTMKQPAMCFILLGLIFILLEAWKSKPFNTTSWIKNEVIYSAGALIPFLITVLLALTFHDFDRFWKWTYTYPKNYISILTLGQGRDNFVGAMLNIMGSYYFLWLLSMAGFIIFLINRNSEKNQKIFLVSFVLLSFLATVPGYYFREHYFIMILPVVSFCIGLGIEQISLLLKKITAFPRLISVGIFLLIVSIGISNHAIYYFIVSPSSLADQANSGNPFNVAEQVGLYIQSSTAPDDKIAVIGSEAELYFYAHRKSATGYLFTYDMVSLQPKNLEMQKEFISEIEKNNPKMMVFVKSGFSWLNHPNSPDSVIKWFNRYANKYYDLVGIAESVPGESIYKWNEEANTYVPQSYNYLMILRRKANL